MRLFALAEHLQPHLHIAKYIRQPASCSLQLLQLRRFILDAGSVSGSGSVSVANAVPFLVALEHFVCQSQRKRDANATLRKGQRVGANRTI